MSAAVAEAAIAMGEFIRDHDLPARSVYVCEVVGRVSATVFVPANGDADQWARHMQPDLTTENHVYADGTAIFEVAGQVADDGFVVRVQADKVWPDGHDGGES